METTLDIKTRGQKKLVGQSILDDPKVILNKVSGNQVEAQKLIEDQIFHDFVEVTIFSSNWISNVPEIRNFYATQILREIDFA